MSEPKFHGAHNKGVKNQMWGEKITIRDEKRYLEMWDTAELAMCAYD
jgi:hypothetical protein